MQNIYLGCQPIIDTQTNVCAYELLYRDSNQDSMITGDRHASASVINSVLNKFGATTILGNKQGFVKIDKKFLMNDLIFTIPNKFFVFSLLESIEINERVIERIEQLHKKGYLLVINDIKLDEAVMEKYRHIFRYISFIKIDFEQESVQGLEKMIAKIKSNGVRVIGTKIEDAKTYYRARKLGCEWFQGYHFAKPKIFESHNCEPSQMKVLKLYKLLIQDTNLDEITLEFEKNPEITIQLLQYINSGVFKFETKIASVHHVLTLVGRKALSEWLMLMIYSKSVATKSQHTPQMMIIKNRTELMKRILQAIKPDARSNMLGEAYLVGLLSLIDVVFKKDIEEILEGIQIKDNIKNAILKRSNILGDIFKFIKELESFNAEAEVAFEKKYNLKRNTIQKLLVKSLEETAKYENPAA